MEGENSSLYLRFRSSGTDALAFRLKQGAVLVNKHWTVLLKAGSLTSQGTEKPDKLCEQPKYYPIYPVV